MELRPKHRGGLSGYTVFLRPLSSSRKAPDDVPLRIRGKDDALIRGIGEMWKVGEIGMFHKRCGTRRIRHALLFQRSLSHSVTAPLF